MKEETLSVDPYKGTRDFYPDEMAIRQYLFTTMRRVVESYGYREYDASIIEETALYRAKSGEEIVNEQTYSFIDRGGRDVTIRPEMTPTVARMVARKRKELAFPLRWYAIPNLLRYERPQRGRLREHWQLNVDHFGSEGFAAEIELLGVAYDIMRAFGASDDMFVIRLNDRRLTNTLLRETLGCSAEEVHAAMKLLDRRAKLPGEAFERDLRAILGEERATRLTHALEERDPPEGSQLRDVCDALREIGITNVAYDPSLMRGFDYYTGTVFEVFDTDPRNNRSLFGGGRYDDLVGLFEVEPVTGVGFGMGDVTMQDFLETHNLLPTDAPVSCDVYFAVMGVEEYRYAQRLARTLRTSWRVVVDTGDRKIGAQVKSADRAGAHYVIVVGADEMRSGSLRVKDMRSGTEHNTAEADLFDTIANLSSSVSEEPASS